MRVITTSVAASSMCLMVAGLVAASVAARPLAAQAPRPLSQPDSVPLDLAGALSAAGGFGAAPQILAGTMPGWVMSKISLPPNARVVGSAFIGTTVVGIVSVDEPPTAAIAAAKSALLAHGWQNPPASPAMQSGGFRSSASAQQGVASATRLVVCGDPQILTAAAAMTRGAATTLTYRMSTTAGYSSCHPPTLNPQNVRLSMPTLINPSGGTEAQDVAQCFPVGGMGGSGTSTFLSTSLTSQALLDHYAKQLADSGWTAESDGVVGRTWTHTDSSGNPVQVLVEIRPVANNARCREATMQVRSLRKP